MADLIKEKEECSILLRFWSSEEFSIATNHVLYRTCNELHMLAGILEIYFMYQHLCVPHTGIKSSLLVIFLLKR